MSLKKNPLSQVTFATLLSSMVVTVSLIPSLPGFALEFPPTRGGAPTRTAGGGMRGNACVSEGKPLTALIPANNLSTLVGKKAVLFVYVPKGGMKAAELSVRDEEDNEIYKQDIMLAGKPGVLQIDVPETTQLVLNKDYFWEFSIVCDPKDRTKDQIVQGVIRRVPLNAGLQSALKQTNQPIEQAELYANAKVWQETLVTAAQLRRSNSKAWEQLLKSIGLESLAKEPFLGGTSN